MWKVWAMQAQGCLAEPVIPTESPAAISHHHTRPVPRLVKEKCSIPTHLPATFQCTPHFLYCSGHGAVKENWFLDDGSYLAVQAVIELVRRRLAGQGDIGDLLKDLHEAKVGGGGRGESVGQVWGRLRVRCVRVSYASLDRRVLSALIPNPL